MSSVSFVKALVFRLNHIFYNETPRTMQVPCEGAEPIAVEYWNPVIANGVQNGYVSTQDPASAKSDTIKTLRIHNAITGDTYWVVVDANGTMDTFADNCNACCGATPDMTTGITIAPAINEQIVLADAAGNKNFLFAVPLNNFGRDLLIKNLTYNGGLLVGATPTAGGYANVAAVITWLNSNASVMGTWTAINSNKTVKLVAATGVNSANLDIELEDGLFCLDLPTTPATIGVLTVKDAANADQNIVLPTLTFSEANRAGVLAELQKHLLGTVALVNVGSPNWKINYAGPMKPVAMKSADLTTTSVPFTTGVCS